MRVLMVTDTAFNGGYVHVSFLSKELKKHNVDLEILSYSKTPVPGVKTRRVASLGFPGIFYKLSLKGISRLVKPFDLVHIHYCSGTLDLMANKIKNLGKPLVGTIHVSPDGKNWIDRIFRIYFRGFLKPCLMASDKVICVSRFVERGLRELGIQNTQAIYNGVDLEVFHPEPGARKVLGIPESDFVILYVGRLSPEKGVLLLLKAFKRLKIPNKKLYIIGSGPLEKLCRLYSKNRRDVVFLGRIETAKLRLYYSAADVSVLPSLWNEAFGMVLIESLACETPVIASRAGGIPEIVDHGKNGFLVEKPHVSEWISRIQESRKQDLQSLGRNGREKVEKNFQWKISGGKTFQVYKSLLGS
ncbi:MAG: hypothetical protein DRP13_01930 [Candidatus Aenigmatarchaeota archaeon]|nr:MAG: hypothetical protein DRP18_01655 [Candidatus Aenigmarchaeota archaeon]RLJ08801.1 MAG: hypothetical protein DRP13_01930 [Candidatus Aenigmarchaeota archaeon]